MRSPQGRRLSSAELVSQWPTSVPAERIASAPPGSRRRPPSDRRRPQHRRRLRAALRRRRRPRRPVAMDAKATSALLVEAFGDIGLETPRRPPPRLGDDRPQLPRRDRPAAGAPGPRRAADRRLPGAATTCSRPPAALALRLHDRARRLRRPPRHRGADVAVLDRQGRRLRPRRRGARRACSRAPQACRAPCSSPPSVGDHAAFERCQALGFTYFQGEYFAKPRTVPPPRRRHRRPRLAAPPGRADRRRRLLRGPRADHLLRRRPVAEAAALRQLRVLRAAAHRVARSARR